MATHPTILGDLARSEMKDDKDSSLDVERDLDIHEGDGEAAPGAPRDRGAASERAAERQRGRDPEDDMA